MPEPDAANVATVSKSESAGIIRLGFCIAGGLTGSVVILSYLPNAGALDAAVLALVSSTITGIFAFLAGRKK